MANISKETYNQRTKIDRMFPQGVEAKEVWFQGDCIFKLASGIEKIQILGGLYEGIMKIGNEIVLFSFTLRTIVRIKNGSSTVDEVIPWEEGITVSVFPLYSREILLMYCPTQKKLYMVRADGVHDFSVSDDFVSAYHYATKGTFPFINNGYLFMGSYTDPTGTDADRNHIHNWLCGFAVDEDCNITREIISERWGVSQSTEMQKDTDYLIGSKILVDYIMYDERTDFVYAVYASKVRNNTLSLHYVKCANFAMTDFDVVETIREYDTSSYMFRSNAGRTWVHIVESVGGYSYPLPQELFYYAQHATYPKLPKYLTSFRNYEYCFFNAPSIKDEYVFDTQMIWFGYDKDEQKYYGVSFDDSVGTKEKGFCWSEDGENWTKISDVGTESDFGAYDYGRGYVNGDGFYFFFYEGNYIRDVEYISF